MKPKNEASSRESAFLFGARFLLLPVWHQGKVRRVFSHEQEPQKKRASEIFFCYTLLPPPPPFDTRGESNPGERRERRRKGKRQQHFLFPLFRRRELERKTAARLCQFLDVLFCHTHTRTLQLPPPGIRLFFGGFWRPRFWWGCAASVSVADQTGCLARKRKRGGFPPFSLFWPAQNTLSEC